MKSSEILRAIYNDKEVLKKVRKSVDDYAMNIVSKLTMKEFIGCSALPKCNHAKW